MATPLSEAQERAIRIFPRVIAALSVLGSGCILYSILSGKLCDGQRRRRRRRQGSTGQHSRGISGRKSSSGNNAIIGQSLMLGMSVADFLSSCSYAIGDIAYPEEANGGNGKGNQATCNFQGFLCNLQVGAALYSAFLAWYYCLYIRYHWQIRGMAQNLQHFETVSHVISWGFVFASGVTSIVKKIYNPNWIRCYIAGPGTSRYVWFFFYIPIWTSMLGGSIAMWLIFLEVRKTEARSLRHTFQHQAAQSMDDPRRQNSSNTNHSSTLSDLPKTRRVANQGLCYTGSFILIYIFPTTSRIWQTVCCKPPYVIRLLATSFVTSQGFFNWFVYFVQPRLVNYWLQRGRQQQQQRTQSTSTARGNSQSVHLQQPPAPPHVAQEQQEPKQYEQKQSAPKDPSSPLASEPP